MNLIVDCKESVQANVQRCALVLPFVLFYELSILPLARLHFVQEQQVLAMRTRIPSLGRHCYCA